MVKSNIKMNPGKLTEFIRILVPEAEEEAVKIEGMEDDEKCTVITSNGKKTVEFSYEKISDSFDDQLDVMARISLLKLYDKDYKWGSLIGVRPTKIVHKFFDSGFNLHYIESILTDFYQVSREKAELLIEIAKRELKYMENRTIGIYIGIAYCPSRCSYCSFPSYLKEGKYLERFEEYYNTLLYEIREIGKLVKELGLEVNTIYVGGGTPSILSKEEMEKMLRVINQNYDIGKLKEFSYELGRIDTIDEEKLEVLKNWNVDRISINPQTFNEEILKELNRYFDKEYFDKVYAEAREMNFVINMDLIIGLPNESTEDILRTLDTVKNYDIENLTIHVLALKKGSNLYREGHIHEEIDYEKIEKKITSITESKELKPYYMYRQKNSLEWGENIGYSVEGKESIFNIQIIEESQSTFGLGGGAITKFTNGAFDEEIELERIVNPKEPLAYIKEMRDRFDKKVKLFKK